MNLYARQGDLVIEKLAKPITGDLLPARDVVFAGDSSGHTHTLRGSCLMRRDGRTHFVRLEKALPLEHAKTDGHKTIELAPGDYEIRPKRERGDASDRAVED